MVRGIEPLSDGAPVKIGDKLSLEAASAPKDAGVAPLVPPAEPEAEPGAGPGSGPGSGAGSGSGSGSNGKHHRKDAP